MLQEEESEKISFSKTITLPKTTYSMKYGKVNDKKDEQI